MKLSTTQNRILGAFLFLAAIVIAYFSEGLLVNFFVGLLSGAGVLLMIKGSLRPGMD